MVKRTERLWSDSELIDMGQTIEHLRKIRTAAVHGLQPPKTGIRGFLERKIGGVLPVPEDRQQVLRDGETLANTAAAYLTRRIIRSERDPARKEAWEELLESVHERYGKFPTTSFAQTPGIEVAGSTLSHLRATHVDPSYMLNWDLFVSNNLGYRNLGELLNAPIVVVAPLSGDLLLAAIHRAQIAINRKRTFHLRTAASSKDLRQIVLPDLSEELSQSYQEVGIFLDVVDTGRTSQALAGAFRESYPGLQIHLPQTKRIEFQPSKRIRTAMGD